ncbi:hypothetical protein KEM56_007231 [Ascosphaera pollenicola]|nr:hypothetical protein KEM56_007231 [Ascosphaera pollenicola]
MADNDHDDFTPSQPPRDIVLTAFLEKATSSTKTDHHSLKATQLSANLPRTASMSEGIKESIPTSQDPRSKRPTKRRITTGVAQQAQQISHLMKDPTKEVRLPAPSKQKTASSLMPPPEIVANVQGSSAGAGSGEFHVYKAARRREYERVRLMEEELAKETQDAEFARRREEARKRDEEKTEKNRKRREKKKAAKTKSQKPTAGPTPVSEPSSSKDVKMDDADKGPEHRREANDADEATEETEGPGVIIHEDD